MALRTPLILNQSTARIEELAVGELIPGSMIDGLRGINALINSNFDFNQRNNSGNITSAAIYTADRWICSSAGGSTCNWGIGATPSGEIPFSRKFLGFNITAGTVSAWIGQRIENAGTFAGGKATVSFWMRSSVAGKKAGILAQQVFGSGGSALTQMEGPVITLGTSFQKYTVTLDIPSVSGKIYGANDNFLLTFFVSDNRPELFGGQLLNQTGLFEIAQVQFERGETATPFDFRPYPLELMLCQRYYEKSYDLATYPGTAAAPGYHNCVAAAGGYFLSSSPTFKSTKRGTPLVNVYRYDNGAVGSFSEYSNTGSLVSSRVASVTGIGAQAFEMRGSGDVNAGNICRYHWAADAEIY